MARSSPNLSGLSYLFFRSFGRRAGQHEATTDRKWKPMFESEQRFLQLWWKRKSSAARPSTLPNNETAISTGPGFPASLEEAMNPFERAQH